MKRFSLFFTLAVMTAVVASAQVDIQLHYDFGRLTNPGAESTRPNVTSTVEAFIPDRLGSTYFFVDMDYYSDGIGGAYWEISREFTFAKAKGNHSFAGHIEYDGGLKKDKYTGYGASYQQCFLLGPAWNWHNDSFSKTASIQLMYKQYLKQTASNLKAHASFQLTGVWSITFAKGLCTFSGFADLWYGYVPTWDENGVQKKDMVFITEPQFWFNIVGRNRQHKKLSVGTELELSNNFIYPSDGYTRTFYFNPTLAVKYTF